MNAATVLLYLATLTSTGEAGRVLAKPQGPAEASSTQARELGRSHVQIGILGELRPEQLSVFAGLLSAELAASALTLELERIATEIGPFVARARLNESVLLIVVVDATNASRWQVFIIDAERGRALVRPLPGGIEQNAAAFEAVSSIVASAVSALREGLEVASLPVESVVSPSASDTPRPRTSAAIVKKAPGQPKISDEPSLLLRGSLAANAASFDRDAPVTFGLFGSLGLTLAPGLGLRASAYRHLSAQFTTPLGSFRLNRTGAALAAGWTLRARRLELEPEAGVTLEWLRRIETRPNAEVGAREDSAEARVGAQLGLRARFRLFEALAFEAAGIGSYYPKPVRFVGTAEQRTRLAEPWPFVVSTQLGVELSSGLF